MSHNFSTSLNTRENCSSLITDLIPWRFHNDILSTAIIIKIIKIIKRDELFLLRGEGLFSEMLEQWVITNNSNTKPVSLQFSICHSTNLAVFVLFALSAGSLPQLLAGIRSLFSCVSGERILQNKKL